MAAQITSTFWRVIFSGIYQRCRHVVYTPYLPFLQNPKAAARRPQVTLGRRGRHPFSASINVCLKSLRQNVLVPSARVIAASWIRGVSSSSSLRLRYGEEKDLGRSWDRGSSLLGDSLHRSNILVLREYSCTISSEENLLGRTTLAKSWSKKP